MSSKIEQIIDELDEYIDNCKYQPFSNSRIVVNKDELNEIIVELRMRVPEEIKKYQKIIAQQEAILNDARSQASNMINDAQAQIDVLVSDHEVMQRAYERANEVIEEARSQADAIVDQAVADANNIREGAMQYTDSLLAEVQNIVTGSAAESKRKMDEMFAAIESVYNECSLNRSQLAVTPAETQQTAAPADYETENNEQ